MYTYMTLLALYIADYMRRTTNRVNNIIFTISVILSCNIRSISSIKKVGKTTKAVSARIKLDSHVDSIVAGENCCVMHYTSRECDVSTYREYTSTQLKCADSPSGNCILVSIYRTNIHLNIE